MALFFSVCYENVLLLLILILYWSNNEICPVLFKLVLTARE
jgi:hypothetical protein